MRAYENYLERDLLLRLPLGSIFDVGFAEDMAVPSIECLSLIFIWSELLGRQPVTLRQYKNIIIQMILFTGWSGVDNMRVLCQAYRRLDQTWLVVSGGWSTSGLGCYLLHPRFMSF